MVLQVSGFSWKTPRFGRFRDSVSGNNVLTRVQASLPKNTDTFRPRDFTPDFTMIAPVPESLSHAEEGDFVQRLKAWLGRLSDFSLFQRSSLPPALYKRLKTLEAIADEPDSRHPQAVAQKKQALLNILSDESLHQEEVLHALVQSLKAGYWELKEPDRDAMRQATVGLWGFLHEMLHPGLPVQQWKGFREVLKLFRTTPNIALKEEILGAVVHFREPMPPSLQRLLKKTAAQRRVPSLKRLAQAALDGRNSFYQALSNRNTMVCPEIYFDLQLNTKRSKRRLPTCKTTVLPGGKAKINSGS